MGDGQVDHAAMELERLRRELLRELQDIATPGSEAAYVVRALDAYVDFRVGWILSQTVFDGARIMRVGECPSIGRVP